MQKGGSQYGVPPLEMPPFDAGSSRPQMVGNISSTQLQPSDTTSPRPPAASRQSNFEELAAAVTGNYPEDDPLGVGEEVERGVSGNRWPRQETLALLKIRSDMDATFRDATLKGPLWEEVSRKLAEQGYTRSAKKCKEKFENVHKYYKRTKDSRAARPDGKSYRFFSQLEALQSASSSPSATATTNTNTPAIVANPASIFSMTAARVPQPTPISSIPPVPPPIAAQPVAPTDTTATTAVAGLSALGGGMSFSSNTSESESETEDEETEERLENQHKRKREPGGWEGGGRGGNRKMMVFFEGLMKQVIERQEAMQQKFLETIEKREQDRMIREEAWRRQEMARLSHEHEVKTQERTVAASRDATIISFLQKITGQTIQLPQPVSATPPPLLHVVSTATAPPPPQQAPPPPKPASTPPPQPQQPTPQQSQSQPQPQQQHQPQLPQSLGQPQQQLQAVPPAPERQQPHPENASLTKPAAVETAPAAQEQQIVHDSETNLASASDPTSSRWPKAEVQALINIRAGMESKYQEAGPKGPLWEEISAAMKHMGYSRNSKRCKEKWENINKYFKKVKESNKKRPEDAKTCPYFHQLDALYRSKILGGSGGGGESSTVSGRMQQQDPDPTVLPITTLPPPGNGGDGTNTNGGGTPKGASQTPTSNGGLLTGSFIQQEPTTDLMKKPEDIVKELMEQRRQRSYPQFDFDKMEEDTDDDEDKDDDGGMDEEEEKMAYKIEFQRPRIASNATSNSSGSKTSRAAASTGSFLAMVHQ